MDWAGQQRLHVLNVGSRHLLLTAPQRRRWASDHGRAGVCCVGWCPGVVRVPLTLVRAHPGKLNLDLLRKPRMFPNHHHGSIG